MKDKIIKGNSLKVLKTLPEGCVDVAITSPPYFNCRDYDVGEGALGLETDPNKYVSNIVQFMAEVHRVLKDNGTLVLNIGDKYYNNQGRHRCNIDKYKRSTHRHFAKMPKLKEVDNYRTFKQQLLLPSRVAIGMQDSLWLLRNEFTWYKKNAVPNCADDRSRPLTEKIYFFTKTKKYYYNKKMGKKHIPTDVIDCKIEPFKKHQASFSEKLIEPFILTLSKPGDVILDPFSGSGTVPFLAKKHNRFFIAIDLSKESCNLTKERLKSLTQ